MSYMPEFANVSCFLLEFKTAMSLATCGDVCPNLLMPHVSLLEFGTAMSKNSDNWYLAYVVSFGNFERGTFLV